MLANLVHNAQEASPENGSIRIYLERQDVSVRLVVEDDGCGMDEAFLRERLFRPFATTKGNAGIGIGMYETRDYIESLGGTLDVTSEPGTGTRVEVLLPLFEEPCLAVAPPAMGGGNVASA